MDRPDRSLLVEMGVVSALGAGIGTILAITYEQVWYLGTIGGCLLSGLLFRPKEAAPLMVMVGKELMGSFAVVKKPALRSKLRSAFFWIAEVWECGLAQTLLTLSFIALWCDVSARFVFPLAVLSVTTGLSWEFGFVTAAMMVACLGMLPIAENVYKRSRKALLNMPGSRRFLYMPLMNHVGWVVVMLSGGLDKRFNAFDIQRGGYLKDRSGSIFSLRRFFFFLGCISACLIVPLLAIPVLLLVMAHVLLDFCITCAFLLASTKRISVMAGALVGALAGYATFAFQGAASVLTAVPVGMVVGAVVGPMVYVVRCWTEYSLHTFIGRQMSET